MCHLLLFLNKPRPFNSEILKWKIKRCSKECETSKLSSL